MSKYCPDTGKIFILIICCLFFSGILIAVNNAISNDAIIDKTSYAFGIIINIIQIIFTLWIIYIDYLPDGCINDNNCNNCKWSNYYNKYYIQYISYFVILLSSSYLLSFGIINLFQNNKVDIYKNDHTDTVIAIGSFIAGVIGFLYIITDFICKFGCGF